MKPREFWIREETELSYNESQIKPAIKAFGVHEFVHVIEYSAVEQLQAKLAIAKEALHKIERWYCDNHFDEDAYLTSVEALKQIEELK